MTLQPLLENAVKHNTFSMNSPLLFRIEYKSGNLVVTNNIQINPNPEPSNGIGLSNLAERFRKLLGEEVYVERTESDFSVIIPIKFNK